MSHQKRLAILVGGGPAPGINSVIGAATIRGVLDGVEVLGIRDGFEWIMKGDISHVRPLTIDEVSRIHFLRRLAHRHLAGQPDPGPAADLENVVIVAAAAERQPQLITIGGDDTAYSAMKVEEKAAGRIKVVHVPKTIDNDLDLPAYVDTFGFQTARHIGAELVKNLMVDAQTTSRWYFVIAMGRKAGHLALGIGKAAGATLTLVPEEWGAGKIHLDSIVDTVVGSIVKRLSYGRRDGVAVLAEGLVLSIPPEDLAELQDVERDAHGHVRIAEVSIGEILKAQVHRRLAEFGIKTTIVAKNIGYELRCADPIPSDMEYTRDLGYCATKYPDLGRERRDDLPPGRTLRAHPVPGHAGPGHRTGPRPPGGHRIDPLRHRPAVHDPVAPRRLRGRPRARQVRRDLRHEPGRVPAAVRGVDRRGAAPAPAGGHAGGGLGGRDEGDA